MSELHWMINSSTLLDDKREIFLLSVSKLLVNCRTSGYFDFFFILFIFINLFI